ncbi:MAG: hypothetical protein PHD37_16665 [Gallionellaceae bacterium]|nr:hypothetical protein [Gallionellaceae bacterium]
MKVKQAKMPSPPVLQGGVTMFSLEQTSLNNQLVMDDSDEFPRSASSAPSSRRRGGIHED